MRKFKRKTEDIILRQFQRWIVEQKTRGGGLSVISSSLDNAINEYLERPDD